MNTKIRVLNHSKKFVIIKNIFIEIKNKKNPCLKSQSKNCHKKIYIEIQIKKSLC